MSAPITTTPAFARWIASSVARRMFSLRSSGVNPRFLLRPDRSASPSRIEVRMPAFRSRRSSACASVDFPEPDSPVIQTMQPRCPRIAERLTRPAPSHQDEAPQGRPPAAHVERDGPANAHPDLRDLVAFALARRSGARLERHGVQRALDPEDVPLGLLSPELEGDELARAKRLVVQPEHPRREGPGLVGPVPGRRPDLAPLHKQLIIESHGDCALRSDGARHGRGLLGPRLDGLHSAALSAGKELDGVPDRYAPGLHKPGEKRS